MKKKYQVLGMIVLLFCSLVYDFQKPEVIEEKKVSSYVMLEGEFLKAGRFEFEKQTTVQDIIEQVGVSERANLDALSLTFIVKDESSLYLPAKGDMSISLNHASKEELMRLDRVGEKTAEKIMAYRNQTPFECIEDLMNVSGIGEKTFLRLRDYLCL